MFHNTGIATYVPVLTNRKPEHRRGKVQLVDSTQWFKPPRMNLGEKNCELSADDITRICDTFLAFEGTEQSKIFPNQALGYWKVTVERPLRLEVELSPESCTLFREECQRYNEVPLANVLDLIADKIVVGLHRDLNQLMVSVEDDAKEHRVKRTARRKKLLKTLLAHRSERARDR